MPDNDAEPLATRFSMTTPPSATEAEGLVGTRLGGYRVDAWIGEGPRALVYRACQVALGRMVALKLLKRDFVMNAERISDYLEAARSASSLIHPNVIQVYDVVSMGDIHFSAVELAEAETLDTWISERRSPPIDLALSLARQACEALRYAHDAARVHGNLCPANVFVGPGERIRLADFCLHPFLPSDPPSDVTDLWRASYVAPEVLRGEEATAQSDFFGLAAVLYHVIVGEPPYAVEEVKARVLGRAPSPSPPSARQIHPAVPSGMSDLLARMLTPDLSARPKDAVEVLAEMEGVAEAVGQGAGPERVREWMEAEARLPPPNRRSYRRMRGDVEVSLTPRKTSQDSAVMLLAKLRDLSENGAFVATDSPLPVGSFVTLEFGLQPGKGEVRVLGVVRWVEAKEPGPGMGVQFLEVSTTDRRNLRDYVDERILDEMVRALTRTQLHRTILQILLNSWGQRLSFARLLSVTGASQTLLRRTLADFERYTLARVDADAVECLRPASEAAVEALAHALKG